MFKSTQMRIAETVNGKREFSKFLTYGLPSLADCGEAFPQPDSWEEDTIKEGDISGVVGRHIYTNDTLQYLQDALSQRIQGLARSRDKAGQEPCYTWEEVAESGGGGIKYPVLLKSFRDQFAAWMASATDLSDKQQAALMSYTDAKLLMRADDHRKERVAAYLGQFIDSLGDKASELASVVTSLNKALEAGEEVDF